MKLFGKELLFNSNKIYHSGDKPLAADIKFTDGKNFQQKLDDGSLKGAKGDKGNTGDRGAQGPAGIAGPTGPKGNTGDKGATGTQGPAGAKGATGPKGADGLTTSIAVNRGTYTQSGGKITLPDYTLNKVFSPGSPGASGRQYVRLFTIQGTGTVDKQYTGILSGVGDYGHASRGTYYIQASVRQDSFGCTIRALSRESSDPCEFFSKKIATSHYEVWVKVADYNSEQALTTLSNYGATIQCDSLTTTAPSGLTAITIGVLYSTANKPSVSDIGAAASSHSHSYLPLSGGTMTGHINLGNNSSTIRGKDNTEIMRDHYNGNVTLSATGTNLYLGYQNTTAVRLEQTMNWKGTRTLVNTSGYIQGDAIRGKISNDNTIVSKTFAMVPPNNEKEFAVIKGFNGDANGMGIAISGSGATLVGSGESADNIITALNLTGKSEDLFLTSDSGVYIASKCNAIAERKTAFYNGSGHLHVPGSFYESSNAGSGGSTWTRVYSPNNKPSASDIGAAASSHTHDDRYFTESEINSKLSGNITNYKTLGTEDLDTIKTPGFYKQDANSNTSAARHYPENSAGNLTVTTGAGVQQTYHVYNSSRVWTRAQYNTGAWTGWAKQYNNLNKPSPGDIGALATSNNVKLHMKSPNGSYNTDVMKTFDGDVNGMGLAMQCGGALVLGGGESAVTYMGTLSNKSAENAYLTADGSVVLASGCQDMNNKKEAVFGGGLFVVNTGATSSSTGIKVQGSSHSMSLWCGTGGTVIQSNGGANLHLGQNNTTDMIFYSDRVEVKKRFKLLQSKLEVDAVPGKDNAHMTIYTAGDGNGAGDGNTHIGYNVNGAMTHYFRGKGRVLIDTLGSIEVTKPWIRLGGKWLTINSTAPSAKTGDVWIQI